MAGVLCLRGMGQPGHEHQPLAIRCELGIIARMSKPDYIGGDTPEAINAANDIGRPSKYRPEYVHKLIEFFSIDPLGVTTVVDGEGDAAKTRIVPNKFPTLARFAANIGVHRDTLHEWARVHPDFSDAYKLAKDFQEANLAEGAMSGAYQQSFAIFAAKNVLGWRDKTEVETTGKDGAPLFPEQPTNPDDLARKIAFLLQKGVRKGTEDGSN